MTNSQRISEIDVEMKVKLQELHDLMSQGGLDASAEVLERDFNVAGNPRNFNTNAMLKLPKFKRGSSFYRDKDDRPSSQNSNSEETIYEKAVQSTNRNSSLSEDVPLDIDTSNEALEASLNQMTMNVGFLAGEI